MQKKRSQRETRAETWMIKNKPELIGTPEFEIAVVQRAKDQSGNSTFMPCMKCGKSMYHWSGVCQACRGERKPKR